MGYDSQEIIVVKTFIRSLSHSELNFLCNKIQLHLSLFTFTLKVKK